MSDVFQTLRLKSTTDIVLVTISRSRLLVVLEHFVY